jgi:hypothetical protein
MMMYENSCSKCGVRFETKNPKRVICPDCLYKARSGEEDMMAPPPSGPREYGPAPGYNNGPPREGYQNPGAYQGQGGGYQNRGGYQGQGGGYQNRGGYQGQGGGYQNRGGYQGQGGGYQNRGPRPQMGGPRRFPPNKKRMFVEPELLAEIEKRYKSALPLPNPDFHTVVGEELQVDPRKIFFGMNLIRQKMNLPKVEMPKRPLAASPEQLQAVQMLYEPYLPTPPIGIHKIISKQLKIDEWRVHVAIKLIRKSRNLPQWNEDRPDLPEAMKVEIEAAKKRMAEDVELQKAHAEAIEAQALLDAAEGNDESTVELEETDMDALPGEEPKKKRGRPRKQPVEAD